jgi:hypothetical protein
MRWSLWLIQEKCVCAPVGVCCPEKKRRMCAEGHILPGEEDVRASEGVWRMSRCLCTGGCMSPGEEKTYVCRGAYVARRRRGVCAPRGICHPEEKVFVRCSKNEAAS